MKSVTGALTAVDGVTRAEVSLEQARAVIGFDAARVDRTQLAQAIEDAGFEAI